ncbi:MAG: hypothetical protein QXF26_10380 [Candidatus Bathyarchaeia archaeon]
MERIKISIEIPRGLTEEIDKLTELLGYDRREQLIGAAIKRQIDEYKRLTRYIYTEQ